MSQERKNWLTYLNPCGGGIRPYWVVNRCYEACKQGGIANKPTCLASGAYQAARYIELEKSTSAVERRDYADMLRAYIGRKVVTVDGELVELTAGNFAELLNSVMARTEAIRNSISVCIEQTLAVDEQYMDKCTDEQNSAMQRVLDINERLRRRDFVPQEIAERDAAEMREALKTALDVGLDELGLVTRQCLAYGLGERVLAKRGIPVNVIPINEGNVEYNVRA